MKAYRIETKPIFVPGTWRRWVDFESEASAQLCKRRMYLSGGLRMAEARVVRIPLAERA